MDRTVNWISISGRLIDKPVVDHEIMGEPFYRCTIGAQRRSEVCDELNVTIPGRIAGELIETDKPLLISGQVRSYNCIQDGLKHLMVTVYAQSIAAADETEARNAVELTGRLLNPPVCRSTPLGRQICDMMLSVVRSHGKSDRIPCIAWDENARRATRFHAGEQLHIIGRLQSRIYQKRYADGRCELRRICEVSCSAVEPAANVTECQLPGLRQEDIGYRQDKDMRLIMPYSC